MIDIPRSTSGRLLPKGRARKVMQVVNEGAQNSSLEWERPTTICSVKVQFLLYTQASFA